METTLTTAGIACIIAAIVGGGLKAFAIEIPALQSGRRQAALGAFGVLLVAMGLGWNRISLTRAPSSSGQPSSGQTPVAANQTPGRPAGQTVSTADCTPSWFANPAPSRFKTIESGTSDAQVLSADQPKDDPVVIVVTEDGKPVGAVAFRLFVSNDLFKITQVVNAACERVETFRNESRGGDRYVLQNDDTVELTFGSLKYSLSLGYHSGSIESRLIRISRADPVQPSRDECLAWFRTPPPERATLVESGTAGAELLTPDQPKDGPVVAVLTDNGKPVGAVALKFYASNDLFKIVHVVNPRCEPLETFRNESRGGDRRVLQNWDTVEMTFGALKYTLRLGYSSGSISSQLNRV